MLNSEAQARIEKHRRERQERDAIRAAAKKRVREFFERHGNRVLVGHSYDFDGCKRHATAVAFKDGDTIKMGVSICSPMDKAHFNKSVGIDEAVGHAQPISLDSQLLEGEFAKLIPLNDEYRSNNMRFVEMCEFLYSVTGRAIRYFKCSPP